MQNASLKSQIRKAVNDQVKQMLDDEENLEKRWIQLHEEERKLWDEYRRLNVK